MSDETTTAERLFRFGAMGSVGLLLNMGITAFLHEVLRAPEELAFAVALVIVFTYNFVSCRHVIFGATSADPKRQLVRYAMASAGFRSAEYLGFLVLHTLAGAPYLLVAMVVLGASFFIKFFFYDRVVFSRDPTAE